MYMDNLEQHLPAIKADDVSQKQNQEGNSQKPEISRFNDVKYLFALDLGK